MRLFHSTRPASPRLLSTPLLTATATALIALAAGCAAPEPGPAATTPTATGPTATEPTVAAGPRTMPSAHVHGVAFDPGDGTLLLATHEGLMELGPQGELTAIGPAIDLMGFTVAGADHYLASGHPGPGVDLPQPVGLIESRDGGRSWAPLSRQGQSDFHALTAFHPSGALGWDGDLRRSADGRTWERLAIPAAPHSLAAAPDGRTVLATTQRGLLRSGDAGSTWSTVPGAPLLQVATWAGDGSSTFGLDPGGTLWMSTDAGGSWRERVRLGEAPYAVAADTDGMRIAVVTEEGLLESTDGGQTFTLVLGH